MRKINKTNFGYSTPSWWKIQTKLFILTLFLFKFVQTSQFDAYTNAEDLSQIGVVHNNQMMNNQVHAELKVRAAF